jgi:hypothetical protein
MNGASLFRNHPTLSGNTHGNKMMACLGVLAIQRNEASRSSYAGKDYNPGKFPKTKRNM